MPSYDWGNTQAASGGSVFIIPNDGYVCTITDAWWCLSRSGEHQLKFVWDVAEGEHANVAQNNGWYESKHCDYISFAPNALRFAKGKMESIASSNPGFDPFAAIGPLPDLKQARAAGMPSDPVQVSAFVGRMVGLVLKVEYGEWQGHQTKKMRVDSYKSVSDIRAGRFKKPAAEEPPQAPVAPTAQVPPTFGQTVGYQTGGDVYSGPAPF